MTKSDAERSRDYRRRRAVEKTAKTDLGLVPVNVTAFVHPEVEKIIRRESAHREDMERHLATALTDWARQKELQRIDATAAECDQRRAFLDTLTQPADVAAS